MNNKINFSGVMEFNGAPYGVEVYDTKIIIGSLSNIGISHDYVIDYDKDFSLDWNLNNAYEIVSKNLE